MDARDYGSVRRELLQAGFGERTARYDESAFGSWFVEVETDPSLRVVWDGRDRLLVVQRGRADGGWDDVWVGRTDAEHSADAVIRALGSI
jgi:hypothetical protein